MAFAGLLLIVLAGGIAAAAVWIDPALDLQIAAWFLTPGVRAALTPFYPWFDTVRDCNVALSSAFVIVAGCTLIIKLIWPRQRTLMSLRTSLLVIFTFALAPGLLVNTILKPHSGRPRPAAVVELGGTQRFVQWWDFSGDCDGNCSFVSGEASGAYALLAPAAAAPMPWRPVAIAAVVVYGTAIGVVRMAVAGHFATDVVFAGVFTALIVWLLYGTIYCWPRTRFTEDSLEQHRARRRARTKM
jgi:lipid A 4'-phosphatase